MRMYIHDQLIPLHPWLEGHGSASTCILACCGFIKNQAMAIGTVRPFPDGIIQCGSLKPRLSVKPCCTHDGIHAPTSFRLPLIFIRALKVSPRQSSIASRTDSLQFWRLKGGSLLVMQFVQTMFSMEQASQGDSMIKMGALRQWAKFAALQQWQDSSNSFRHSGMGNPLPSSRVILKRLSETALIVSILANGEKYSAIKRPLSGMAYTFAVLVFSMRQLEQRKVAMPPAETPVMTKVSPLQKSNYLSRNRKCQRVLL